MAEKKEKEKESKFTGGVFGYIVTNGAVFAALIFTAGLLMPFAICFQARWNAKNTIIDGKQHEFYGSAWVLFLRKVLWLLFGPIVIAIALGILFGLMPQGDGSGIPAWAVALIPTLTVIAIGVFMAWMSLRMKKWIVRHTRVHQGD